VVPFKLSAASVPVITIVLVPSIASRERKSCERNCPRSGMAKSKSAIALP
jgi:hypothetical protein